MQLDVTHHDSSFELKYRGHRFGFSLVSWDSEALRLPVYHLSNVTPLYFPTAENSEEINAYIKSKSASSNAMLTARIPATEIVVAKLLQEIGFYFVEMTLHPTLNLQSEARKDEFHFEMRQANESDLALMLVESEEAFQHSRFFRDPMVSREGAKTRFREWVRSSQQSENKRSWIFLDHDGRAVAFFIDRVTHSEAFLELTAMFSQFRGQGEAKQVWETYLAFQRRAGIQSVKTNISAENSAVVAIYPKLGFKFAPASIAFHKHL